MEIWESIPNFSRYEISNTGKVRSLNYKNSGRIVELKPCIDGGYLKTMILGDNGRYKTVKIHSLVALVFHGEMPKDKDEINHKDGVKTNNCPDNLEYVTRQENIKHSIDNKLQTAFVGSQVGTSKLTEEQVLWLRKLRSERGRFWGRNEIAKELGVAPKHLQLIINHPDKAWKHISILTT